MSSRRPAKLEEYRSADIAQRYNQRWSGKLGQRRDQRKARALERALAVVAEDGLRPPASFLDLPCGTGRFTSLLRARGDYLGVDLSAQMLAQARAGQDARAGLAAPAGQDAREWQQAATRLVAADGERLPLADGAVEVAVCIRFLHLIRQPDLRVRFLKELARVSRRAVVVDFRHNRTLRVWGRHLRHRLGLRDRAPSNPGLSAIRAELAAAGLHPQRLIRVHFAPLLSDKILVVARHVCSNPN